MSSPWDNSKPKWKPKKQGKPPSPYGAPKSKQQTSARWLAFRAIQSYDIRGAFVSHELSQLFEQLKVPKLERRLATVLANEVIRRRRTLDTILASFVKRDREDVEDELWNVLQLGCYQILFGAEIAEHAAVNETVELCRPLNREGAKGFINGTLRSIQRSIKTPTDEPVSMASASPMRIPTARLDGFEIHHEYIELDRPVFSLPKLNLAGYLGQTMSLPDEAVERFLSQLENPDDVLRTALWHSTPGRMSMRVNLEQATREQVMEVLLAADVTAREGKLPESIELVGGLNPVDIPGYSEGWFSVQDDSAMGATDLLAPQADESILDLCAAPGGKTTHIAERLRGTGRVVACDVSAKRLEIVKENAQRLQLKQIECQPVESEERAPFSAEFDAVLVDVPCSNTGVLGKRPEARWRLTQTTFDELIPQQKRLLADAIAFTKPTGRVLYSTCSIDHEENRAVVEAVLADHLDWELATEQTHSPGQPSDGGYQALLKRKG